MIEHNFSLLKFYKAPYIYGCMMLCYYRYLYPAFSSGVTTLLSGAEASLLASLTVQFKTHSILWATVLHTIMRRQELLANKNSDYHADLDFSSQDAFCNSIPHCPICYVTQKKTTVS